MVAIKKINLLSPIRRVIKKRSSDSSNSSSSSDVKQKTNKSKRKEKKKKKRRGFFDQERYRHHFHHEVDEGSGQLSCSECANEGGEKSQNLIELEEELQQQQQQQQNNNSGLTSTTITTTAAAATTAPIEIREIRQRYKSAAETVVLSDVLEDIMVENDEIIRSSSMKLGCSINTTTDDVHASLYACVDATADELTYLDRVASGGTGSTFTSSMRSDSFTGMQSSSSFTTTTNNTMLRENKTLLRNSLLKASFSSKPELMVEKMEQMISERTLLVDRNHATKVIIIDHFDDRGTYTGQIFEGEPNGFGVMVYDDHRRYQGDWAGGRFHGSGIMVYSHSGDVYTGHYENDLMHGIGTYTWKDGRVYKGEFVDDVREGHGVYTWPDGSSHEGNFIDGQMHGDGTHIYTCGSKYHGDFAFGYPHGDGVYTCCSGLLEYQGQFQKGFKHGQGKEIYIPNNSIRLKGIWNQGNPPSDDTKQTSTSTASNNTTNNHPPNQLFDEYYQQKKHLIEI